MEATLSPRKRRRPATRWLVLGTVVLLLGAAAWLLRGGLGSARLAAANAQSGETAVAFTGDITASITASGAVTPRQTTQLSPNSPAIVAERLVEPGARVAAGDPLLRLEADALAIQVERADQALRLAEADLALLLADPDAADVTAAEAAVRSAQLNLESILAGPDAQSVAESEANVRAQNAAVAAAAAGYNSTAAAVSASAIAAAEVELLNAERAYDNARRTNEANPNSATDAALQSAADTLAIAQANLAALRAGPNQGTLNSAAAGISAAAANADQSEANLAALLAGPTSGRVAAAEAAIAQAEANLAALLEPAGDADIAIAQATVTQARLTLLDAEEALAEATLVAPFDGVVTAVTVEVGELASGAVVTLISDALDVILAVDEVDIGVLRVGQTAVVLLEAWPDTTIPAAIAAIAPSAGNVDGIATYDVTLRLNAVDLPVRVGMTANAQLVTATIEEALLVPNAAITADRAAGTYTVHRQAGSDENGPVFETVAVTIGLRDGTFTQITGGLDSGDAVLIGELQAPVNNGGFGPPN